jgi:hypothetical protein
VSAPPIVYDPFNQARAEGQITAEVALMDDDSCDVVVALTDDAGQYVPEVQFGTASSPLTVSAIPTGNAGASVIPGAASVRLGPDRRQARVSWTLRAISNSVIPPGELTQNLRVALIEPARQEGVPITVAVRTLPRAQANFAGTAGNGDTATLDFGELREGAERSALLQIRANSMSQLTMESRNHGDMVNATGARIPYRLYFDGTPVNLGGIAVIAVPVSLQLAGTTKELRVVIGSVRGAPAGRYSDTIEIDISP